MKTSSKYRRLVRQRKLRRQRSAALMVLMVVLVMFAHAAFSNYSGADSKMDVISVVVTSGDTIWDIARRYLPEGKNLCEYVHEIEVNNGIRDGLIVCGETLFVPVEK